MLDKPLKDWLSDYETEIASLYEMTQIGDKYAGDINSFVKFIVKYTSSAPKV